MFDAEKIPGGLLLGGTRRRNSPGSLMPGGAGMALLGVAIEAFEHFTKKPAGGATPPPPPGAGTRSVPPAPPPGPPPIPGSKPPPPPDGSR